MSAPATRVAIVSGAARGLGHAITRAIASAGWEVVAFDKQPDVAQVFEGANCIHARQADVSVRADVEQVVQAAQNIGTLDVLINNAAVCEPTPLDLAWEESLRRWQTMLDTNVMGVMLLSRAAVPAIIEGGGGHIVNITTDDVLPAVADNTNPVDRDAYSASKWALNGFTDAWAKTLARHKIRVNGLCYGALATPLHAPSEFGQNVDQAAGAVIELLTSERTGENIAVDGSQLADTKPLHQRITG